MKDLKKLINDYIVEKHMKAGEYVDISEYDNLFNVSSPHELICSEVETGGMAGLHCDGGFLEPYQTGNNQNEIRLLSSILDELTPEIEDSEKSKIYDLIKSDSYTNCKDYYGNTQNYQINYIVIKDFIDSLEELKLFDVACENINKIEVKRNDNRKRIRP